MAIGTAAAIGIGLAGAGQLLGSKSQSKAAKTAANTELQVAAQNNALAQNIYGQNQQALAPFMQRGNAAGDTMNALLGLGGQAPQVQSYYSGANPSAQPISWADFQEQTAGMSTDQLLGQTHALRRRNALLAGPAPQPRPPQAPRAGVNPQQAAGKAFDIFRNSTGYQFRLGEGMNALNSGYAGAGVLRSGAAMKAATEYGQNFASNEFGNYLGYLGNQQGVGLSGASALAGVGQNYANSVMANNQNAGSAVANAALVRGANNPFANTLSLLGGGLFGYGR